MRLIDAQPAPTLRDLMPPGEGRRVPVEGREMLAFFILNHPATEGRNTVHAAIGALYMNHDSAAMYQTLCIEGVGQEDRPDAVGISYQQIQLPIPLIEIANESE